MEVVAVDYDTEERQVINVSFVEGSNRTLLTFDSAQLRASRRYKLIVKASNSAGNSTLSAMISKYESVLNNSYIGQLI